MKKILAGAILAALFIGCGSGPSVPNLNQVTKKGLVSIKKGMTQAQVMKILKREPDTIQKIGNYELWIYEGVVTNEETGTKRYKNFTIKFENGKVDYTGYFGCKLPKTEE